MTLYLTAAHTRLLGSAGTSGDLSPQDRAWRAAVERTMSEHQEQVTVIQWKDAHLAQLPALALLYAVPNGGDRHPATAARLRAEGVVKGVPDLVLPVPRPRRPSDPPSPPGTPPGWWCGWYGELKRVKGGRVAKEQRDWHARLTAAGYFVAVYRGGAAMIAGLCDYLGND